MAAKINCTAETLRRWVRQADTDSGELEGITVSERERIKALGREMQELRQANEILPKASAYVVQSVPASKVSVSSLARPGAERASA